MNLPDTYLHYIGKFHMNKIKFVIHEKVLKIDKSWKYEGKIIEIEFINYFLKGEFFKKGMLIKMSLEDTLIKQDKIKNPNYSAILFGDVNTKGKILDIEFEINPNLECSDMRFTMKAERGIYIICDLYVIQYIQYKVMKVLSTSINFTEIANYAKDSVSQYIQLEYANNFLKGNYKHNNIYLDIVFNSPIILLPVNIFDYNNTSCIKLSIIIQVVLNYPLVNLSEVANYLREWFLVKIIHLSKMKNCFLIFINLKCLEEKCLQLMIVL